MEYVVLMAMHELHGAMKTLLVDKEDYDGEGMNPEDYFSPEWIEAKVIGEVEITGDTDMLGNVYAEEM